MVNIPLLRELTPPAALKSEPTRRADHKMSRHCVAALANGTTIGCVLRLASKHLVIAVSANIMLKEY